MNDMNRKRMIFSLHPKVVELLDTLPEGKRSNFVENLLLKEFGYKIVKGEDELKKL